MGRTWVLLRGLVREQRHWEDFPARLQKALPEDRVVLLDLPGNGKLHDQESPTQVAGMVRSVREQLRERGVQGPYHVVALSLGAMLAVQWACMAPQEIAFAALINTSANRYSPFWRRLSPVVYPRLIKDAIFSRLPLQKELAILELTSNLHDGAFLQELAQKWSRYAETRPVSVKNSLRQLWAAIRFRAPSGLPAGLPVVIINGGGDRLVDPSCSRAIATAWDCPLCVHPEAGHDLPLDDPHWLIETLIEAVT